MACLTRAAVPYNGRLEQPRYLPPASYVENCVNIEHVRQAMLEQMGITPWYPRAHLSGAAPSHPQLRQALRERASGTYRQPLSVTPATPAATRASAASESPRVPESGEAPVKAPTSALQRMLQQSAPQSSPTAPDPVPASPASHSKTLRSEAAPSVEKAPDVQFAFCWIYLDAHLAILAELPAGSRQLTREARHMVVNIAGALHPRYRGASVQEHNFHWPFILGDGGAAAGLPVDARAAQHAVDGFIARRQHDAPVSHVLILSESMPFYLADPVHPHSPLGPDPRHGFRMLHTHALHAMLDNTTLKRAAWQAMQVMVSALQASQG